MLYRKDLKIEQLEINGASRASIIRIVLICRTPISANNALTYALFFDEFSTLLEPVVSASSKLLLAGDLNFRVNNPSEGNAYQFLNVLSYFNLNALNVNIPIHKVITFWILLLPDVEKTPLLIYQSTNPIVSKHPAVHCMLDFERPSNKKVVLTSRKLSNMSSKHIKTV